MNADHAEQVVRRLVGYWPSPQLSDEEVVAWIEELTNPDRAITSTEAIAALRKASYSGQVHRPRVGEIVAAVLAERRATAAVIDTSRMLGTGRAGAVTSERAGQWARACRRVLAGEPLESAQAAEGMAT